MTVARPVAALLFGIALLAALFALAEIGVRLADVEPPAWPPVGGMSLYPGLDADPILGPVPRPGWSGDWPQIERRDGTRGPDFRVSFDERAARVVAPTRSDSRPRVLLLGDSVTFGWGVDDAETFAWALAAPGDLDVVNAAFPGHSAVLGDEVLRERTSAMAPDVVVIAFSANNAFRFTLAPDAARVRGARLLRAALHSRVLHLALALRARRSHGAPLERPRDRDALVERPIDALSRVASPDEYEAALRRMISRVRAGGGRPLLVAFPRAMQVSKRFRSEDAAWRARGSRRRPRNAESDLGLVELACLDPATSNVAARALDEGRRWVPSWPSVARDSAILERASAQYVRGDLPASEDLLRAALSQNPRQPFALYALGVVEMSTGRASEGLERLADAVRASCSVFPIYAQRLWKVALDEDVPVVDFLPSLPAAGAGPMFLDPAHLTREGHAAVAASLRAAIDGLRVDRPAH